MIKPLRPVALAAAFLVSSGAPTVRAYGGAAANSQAPAVAPPAASPRDTLKSPDVNSGGRVTFRLYAPDAKAVQVQASGLEATPGATTEEMTKSAAGYPMTRGDQGVWSFTLGPIQPGVYRYTFVVDGVQTTDPRNPVVSESLNSVKSMYEIPGASFLEYKDSVPHGAMATVWYHSNAVNGLRRMHIYTPPGYERGSSRYPVLFLLHGGGDTDDSWSTVGRAGAILDNLIAAPPRCAHDRRHACRTHLA